MHFHKSLKIPKTVSVLKYPVWLWYHWFNTAIYFTPGSCDPDPLHPWEAVPGFARALPRAKWRATSLNLYYLLFLFLFLFSIKLLLLLLFFLFHKWYIFGIGIFRKYRKAKKKIMKWEPRRRCFLCFSPLCLCFHISQSFQGLGSRGEISVDPCPPPMHSGSVPFWISFVTLGASRFI